MNKKKLIFLLGSSTFLGLSSSIIPVLCATNNTKNIQKQEESSTLSTIRGNGTTINEITSVDVKNPTHQLDTSMISYIPSFYINNFLIKNFLLANKDRFFTNLPSDFNANHLEVKIVTRDDKNGSIGIRYKLTKIKNENGVDVNEHSKEKDTNLTGFRPGNPTEFTENPGIDKNRKASEVRDDELNQLVHADTQEFKVYEKGKSYGINGSQNEVFAPNEQLFYKDENQDWKIAYFDLLEGFNEKFFTMENTPFNGFEKKITLKTDLYCIVASPDFHHYQVIKGNADDVSGTLSLLIVQLDKTKPNRFLDENGSLTSTLNKQLDISGFIQSNTTPIQKDIFTIDELTGGNNYLNKTPNEISENPIKSLVFQNIDKFYNGLPKNLKEDNISNSVIQKKSIEGSIEITINLNKYYQNGVLIDGGSKYLTKKITITGFNNQLPSNLTNVSFNQRDPGEKWDQNNINFIKTQTKEELKKSKYNLPSDFEITNFDVKNDSMASLGTVVFSATIDNYFDGLGNLSGPITIDITVEGFRILNTTIPGRDQPFMYDDSNTSVDDLSANQEQLKNFVWQKIKTNNIIQGDINGVDKISNFPKNKFNVEILEINHVAKTLKVKIIFEPNLFYENGNLIQSNVEVPIFIKCIADKVTTLKKESFSYKEIWNNQSPPALDENQIINNDYFIQAIFNAKDKIFNNLPNAGINLSDITITNQINLGLQNIYNGTVTFDFSLSSALPTAKQFTITFTGFKRRITKLNGSTVWPLGTHDVTSDTIKKTDILRLIKQNDEYLRRFADLPQQYDPNNIDVVESSIKANVASGSVTFDVVLNNVYGDNNTFSANITITGYQTIDITTSIKSGTINQNSAVATLLPSEIKNEKLKELAEAIISTKPPLIINLPPDVVILKDDLEITIQQDGVNDAQGYLILDITIKNNKGWENGVKKDRLLIRNIVIEGFRKRTPTSWQTNNIIEDKYFGNFYASQESFGEDKIKQYVVNNKDKFLSNYPPEITQDDIVISNVVYSSPQKGTIDFTLGIKKYYDKDNGLLATDATATRFTHQFTLSGFDTRKTTLKNNGAFFYEDFHWNEFGENKPSLDDSRLTKAFFLNWIMNERDKIFNDPPSTITPENIQITSFSLDGKQNNSAEYIESVVKGSLIIKFTLTNAKPSTKTFTLTISNFMPKETTILANEFAFGDNSLPNNSIDEQWIKNKIIEKHKDIFENLPNNFDLNDNNQLIISNLDKSVAGQITFKIKLKNVFSLTTPNEPGVLEKQITFTNFRTEGITTVINYDNRRFTDVPKLASWYNDNQNDLKEAIIRNNLISHPASTILPEDIELSGIKDINDLTGSLKFNITLINSKGWVNGDKQESLNLGEVFISGFKTRNKTEFVSNESIAREDLFGKIWVREFSETKIKEFIHDNQSLFFTNAPKDISLADFYISNLSSDGIKGEVSFTLGLRKYYSSTNGLLVHDSNPSTPPKLTKGFILSGFRKNVRKSSTMKFNTLSPNDNLFNRIFKNNKGYAIDWYIEEKYQDYQLELLAFINKNLENNALELFENTSINGYKTRAVKVEIKPFSPPKNGREDLETEIIVTFNQWLFLGEPKDGWEEKITLKLKGYESVGPVIRNSIEESLNSSVSLMNTENNEYKVKKIKEIIIEQINEKKDILPNSLIPSRGYFTLYDDAIKKIEVNFEQNGSISVRNIQIYKQENSMKDARLILNNINVKPLIIKTNSWITYLFIGGLSSLFILLIIALVYLVIKRKNSNTLENRDYW